MKLHVHDSMNRHLTRALPQQASASRYLELRTVSAASHAFVALALGALAVGAMAIGAVTIGRLAIGRARIRRLEIDELVVRQFRATEDLRAPPKPGPET